MAERFVTDGTWTWFNDPRAIVRNGALYVGFIRSNGDVCVTKIVLSTGARSSFVLAAALEVDDHDDPALVFLPGGRLLAAYSKHGGAGQSVRIRVSTSAEDVTAWGAETTVPNVSPTGFDRGSAYANPWVLADEGDRLYMMFRGANWFPVIVYSDDWDTGLPTWSTPREIFSDSAVNNRPYVKYISDGTSRLHFFASSGHPQDITAGAGHMWHWYYDAADGNFHTSDGTAIRSLASLATTGRLTTSEVTKVYDATTHSGGGNGNAWPWSIELDGSGNPVVAYSVFQAIDDNDYHYARWTGSAWDRHTILSGQGSLYGAGDTAEDQYVGGICIDPRDTSRLYLANDTTGQWEIEKWETANGGTSWTTTAVTSASSVKNARPYCPRAWSSGAPDVIWWRGSYTDFDTFATELWASPALATQTYREVLAALAPTEHLSHDDPSGTVADALAGTDGTYVNAPTLGAAGLIAEGAAVTYNGTTQRCDLPDIGAAEGSFTYACFFKSTQTGNDRWIMSEGSTASNNPWGALILQSGRIRGSVKGTGGTEVQALSAAGPIYNDGNRHHAVVTWDGATIRTYVDGVLRASTAGTPGARAVNTTTIAALRRASVGQWFAGTVDEPAIWISALTASQIDALFEARDGLPGTAVSITPAATTDIAQSLSVTKRATIAPVATGDAARALTARKLATLGPATTVDVAQPLTVSIGQRVSISAATTTDQAQPLTVSKRVTIAPTATTDTPQPIVAAKRVTLTPASSTDVAPQLAISKRATITPAQTSDVALPAIATKYVAIMPGLTTDTAQGISVVKRLTLIPATTTDTAQALSAMEFNVIPGPVTAIAAGGPRVTSAGQGTIKAAHGGTA